MIKYYAAAMALKMFSLNDTTVKAYRQLGNVLGARRRASALRSGYFARANRNLRFVEANGGISDGMTVMELGTGWVHWEALFTSAFYDVNFIVFDVWDNRQFSGFKFHVRELRNRMRAELDRTEEEYARAEKKLDAALQCENFEEFYRLFGWKYVTDWDGSLDAIETESLDLIISSDVLEHVHIDGFPGLAKAHKRILKPGGRASHQVVFLDHLCIYDRPTHPKNYLVYSDATWKRFGGENRVQYVNRLQPSELERYFLTEGLKVRAVDVTDRCNIDALKVSSRFAGLSRDDLETGVKSIMFEKPVGEG